MGDEDVMVSLVKYCSQSTATGQPDHQSLLLKRQGMVDSRERPYLQKMKKKSQRTTRQGQTFVFLRLTMAESHLFELQDEITCSLCQDILSDPVLIPCGHNFCLKCLTDCWDHSRVCSCPQCRHTFTTRPELNRNPLLNEVIQKLKKMGLSPPQSQNYAGPGDVECDFCTGKKFRAVKSCLTCMISFCQTHLQPHFEVAAWKDHKLTDPDGNLKEKFCAKHQKILEIFCKTDDMCICLVCGENEHEGHEKVELARERKEKEKQLGGTMSEIKKRLEEREKTLEETRRAMEQMKVSVGRELEENEKSFTDLIHCIEEAYRKVTERIREQEKREMEKAEGVMERLEKEIEELKRKDIELMELLETKDHVHFLKNFSSRCVLPADADSLSFTVTADFSCEDLRKELACLKKSLEKISQWDIKTLTSVNSLDCFGVSPFFLSHNAPVSRPPSFSAHQTLNTALSDGYT
ncbi:TRI25 ligase, partial [Polypterus senegalus]